ETKRFVFSLMAPETEGQVLFAANMVRDGVTWMAGSGISRVIEIVEATSPPAEPAAPIDPPDNPDRTPATIIHVDPAMIGDETITSSVISENLPDTMETSTIMNITITLQNSGEVSWDPNSLDRFGALGDNTIL